MATLGQSILLLEKLRSYFSPQKTIVNEHEESF
jgi:hypothetical protein